MTDFENQVLNQLYEISDQLDEQEKILGRIADATETVRMLETDNSEALNDIKNDMPNLD
jgi:hypothetical protein